MFNTLSFLSEGKEVQGTAYCYKEKLTTPQATV